MRIPIAPHADVAIFGILSVLTRFIIGLLAINIHEQPVAIGLGTNQLATNNQCRISLLEMGWEQWDPEQWDPEQWGLCESLSNTAVLTSGPWRATNTEVFVNVFEVINITQGFLSLGCLCSTDK